MSSARCRPRWRWRIADPRRELSLQAALGWSLGHTTGTARETAVAWATALRLAEELHDSDYQLRALWGLWGHHINRGEFRQALSLAERFGAVATEASATSDRLVGERMLGVVLHFLGEQPRARGPYRTDAGALCRPPEPV